MDIQVIVDADACARYMAKYAAKGEPRSKSLTDIFKSCIENLTSTPSALRRAMIRAVGERDFSSQETAHMLLSLPLTSCSYSFVTLSLTGDRRVAETGQQLEIQESFLDHYGNRTKHLDIKILQYAFFVSRATEEA